MKNNMDEKQLVYRIIRSVGTDTLEGEKIMRRIHERNDSKRLAQEREELLERYHNSNPESGLDHTYYFRADYKE